MLLNLEKRLLRLSQFHHQLLILFDGLKKKI